MVDPCKVAGAIPCSRLTSESAPDTDSGATMVVRERFSYQAIHDVLSGLLEQDLHAKRVNSLCDATLGVLHSGSLAVCTIGQGLAAARSPKPKHGIKQVDRLVSNPAIYVDDILVRWVPFVIGTRESIPRAGNRSRDFARIYQLRRPQDSFRNRPAAARFFYVAWKMRGCLGVPGA